MFKALNAIGLMLLARNHAVAVKQALFNRFLPSGVHDEMGLIKSDFRFLVK